MTRSFSVFLDGLRVSAAVVVLLSHLPELTPIRTGVSLRLGHSAVIVFFVLSGYLIRFVARGREHRLTVFAASRAARIYSVALPALLVTAGVDFILWSSGSAAIPSYQFAHAWKYLPLFLAFANRLWDLKEDAFTDVPYWSLCYEVWYYALFAAAFYLRGAKRGVAVPAILVLMGPKLWLLLPCWLIGCGVQHLHESRRLSVRRARTLAAAALGLMALVWGFGLDGDLDRWLDALSGGWVQTHLGYARYVAGDLPDAVLVAVLIFAARDAALRFGPLARPIAAAASCTFTLYLMHYPLIQLFGIYFSLPAPLLVGAVLISVGLLAPVTEWQKPRLQAVLLRVFAPLARAPSPG